MTNPTPDFRTELARLVDLYYALGGNWSPHGYTDTWNDALASARIALATPPSEPPTDEELLRLYGVATPCYHVEEFKRELNFVRAALERWGHG